MYSQDQEIQKLFEKATQQISEQDVYGDYTKPKCLIKLESLVKQKELNLQTIGFFL